MADAFLLNHEINRREKDIEKEKKRKEKILNKKNTH